MRLERWAEKSARNLLESLRASKEVPFERVLYGLGIRYVGETVAKKLALTFKTIDRLREATLEELTATPDVGERIAASVVKYFSDPRNVEIVERLKNYGLQMEVGEETAALQTEKLKGLSIVISGTFAHHSRDEYKEMIERNGGKNVGSVSKKTSFILAGENMGPSKLEKAAALGVKLMTEDEFLKMLEDA